MKWIASLFITAFAVLIAAYILPGVTIANYTTAIIVALVLALLNTILKPILIILTIPITILTLGLFLIVINALIILLADDLISGFTVDSFWWAILYSFILSIINAIFGQLAFKSEKQ